jgi:hypothetical protein
MINYTRCKVLLPEWILSQRVDLPENDFLALVRQYLTRYPNYRFIRFENGLAVCDREDEVKERRKRG